LLMRLHIAYKIYRPSWHIKKSLIPHKIQTSYADDIIIFNLEGPFFFGVAEQLEHALETTHTDPKAIIFSFAQVPFIDMTGLETLKKVTERYHKRGVHVYYCQANETVAHKLKKMAVIKQTEQASSSLEDVLACHKAQK